ncbi:MAG: FAD-dependent oxidoreductase [Slackia sp.]
MGVDPSTLSVDDILKIEDEGVAIAQGLKDMGFEAIEINAAGFNMGEKFLSRAYNTRTDEYGAASFENRARFVTESIEKIKEACGEDFVVQVLMDCIEDNDNLTNNATLMNLDNTITAPHNTVTTVEEGIELAKLFEAAGCDSLHLRLGPLGNHPCQFGSDLYFILNGIEGATGYGTQYDFNRHWQGQLIGNHSGAGMLLDVVARYKEAVSIPCGTVTYMDPAHAPDYFEQALADGKADFYMMTRPLTVDTEYVNKLRDGRRDEIAPCTRCLHCHIGSNQMNATMGYCRVNALTQRVMREGGPATYELPAAEAVKNVMVVGAGPAGMEAARIAAARGHKVTLYEKGSSVGGRLEFASNVKGPHENLDDFSAYLQRQLEITGVELVTDKEVDASLVESVAPDALVIATGGLRDTLEVPGAADGLVVDFEQFMTADLGENVVVWGSNAQAFDAALRLTVHKKNVTMVTPSANADLDKQQSQHAMRFMTTALYALGLNVYPSASIKEAREGEIVVTTETGTEVTVACDAIVNGADMLPDSSLKDATSVAETYVIGDAAEPFNIAMAIRGGNDVGRAL